MANLYSLRMGTGDILIYESNGANWTRVDYFSFPVVCKPTQQDVQVKTIIYYYDHKNTLYIYI
ncbi:hypothetical protein BG74_09465 [Sodalis-like endosymbiont of Proechinophthirus fluctus]|nr:hypothetical protein BG74_09465 [Sodalis-like endosymbiont of Proechinophthirus fluctus]